MTLAITGQIPSGKNAVKITRAGFHYPAPRFKLWRDEAVRALSQQWKYDCLTTPIGLCCQYWPGDRRIRDVSGMLDALFHALVKAGILADDGLIHDVVWKRHPINRQFPKVVMEIVVLEEGE